MVQQKTLIEWTDRTWNPIRGCSPVSPGCRNCYASYTARRFSGKGRPFEGLVTLSGKWNGKVRFVPEKLLEPLHWRTPCRIFVNSMSDVFHKALSFEQIAELFAVVSICRQHTFQIVTKRVADAVEWFRLAEAYAPDDGGTGPSRAMFDAICCSASAYPESYDVDGPPLADEWPPPNLELIATCEDQRRADERIPLLLRCPAAVRGVSLEPLLEPIDIGCWLYRGVIEAKPGDPDYDALQWVIVGCESGVGRRPCDVAWIRSIVDQCRTARVPVFVKQLSLGGKVSRDPSEWPEDLRVRMFAGQRWS